MLLTGVHLLPHKTSPTPNQVKRPPPDQSTLTLHISTHRSRNNTMARERRLPSNRSSAFARKRQAKAPAETQTRDHDDKPAIEKSMNDVSRTAASSARGDETNKHDEHDDREPQQNSSAEVLQDTRTFQQLVHDYGNDSKCGSYLMMPLFVLDREPGAC